MANRKFITPYRKNRHSIRKGCAYFSPSAFENFVVPTNNDKDFGLGRF